MTRRQRNISCNFLRTAPRSELGQHQYSDSCHLENSSLSAIPTSGRGTEQPGFLKLKAVDLQSGRLRARRNMVFRESNCRNSTCSARQGDVGVTELNRMGLLVGSSWPDKIW